MDTYGPIVAENGEDSMPPSPSRSPRAHARVCQARALPTARAVLGIVCPVALAAALVAGGCGRRLQEDEEAVVPKHRVQPCKDWCAMVTDPECLPMEALKYPAPTPQYEECFEGCIVSDLMWGPLPDGTDDCKDEYTAHSACMSALSCEEQHEHHAGINVVPTLELSCGETLQARMDCSQRHYT